MKRAAWIVLALMVTLAGYAQAQQPPREKLPEPCVEITLNLQDVSVADLQKLSVPPQALAQALPRGTTADQRLWVKMELSVCLKQPGKQG